MHVGLLILAEGFDVWDLLFFQFLIKFVKMNFTVFLVIYRVCFYRLSIFILRLFNSILHNPRIFHHWTWQSLIGFIRKRIRPSYLRKRINKIWFLFLFFLLTTKPICFRVTYFQVAYTKGWVFHVKLFTILKKLLINFTLTHINYFLYFLFAHHIFNHLY